MKGLFSEKSAATAAVDDLRLMAMISSVSRPPVSSAGTPVLSASCETKAAWDLVRVLAVLACVT
jgi:hypothetical protein